jgi:hypothetical protein
MQAYLRSKTWEEKVASIERMDPASKLAREAMKKAMAKEAADDAFNASTGTPRH